MLSKRLLSFLCSLLLSAVAVGQNTSPGSKSRHPYPDGKHELASLAKSIRI